MAASRSKLLGDGRDHGLAGGTSLVATPPPRQGEHAFNHVGKCACGVEQCFSAGKAWYRTMAGWGLGVPICKASLPSPCHGVLRGVLGAIVARCELKPDEHVGALHRGEGWMWFKDNADGAARRVQ